jgi:ketosteroid isomerase-like protein
MTEESTTSDLARRAQQGYEAASRGDIDRVMSLFAADAVYDMSAAGFETSEGADAIRCFIEGGRLVGGEGRVEQRVAHLTTWAYGKIEWFKHYHDPDEARAAAERLAQGG